MREKGRNDVWDGFVEDLDAASFSTRRNFSERDLTATMDIPSTQIWNAMKTMSKAGLNIGVADKPDSVFRTFSLGIVQSIVIVRKVPSGFSYPNSRCCRPIEGNQTVAAKHHVGAGLTQSFDLNHGPPISINGVDLSESLLRFFSYSTGNSGRECTHVCVTL